jgi:hypothetical protein
VKQVALSLLVAGALVVLCMRIAGFLHWSITDSASVIGLLGVSAALVSLLPLGSKAKCELVEAWLEPTRSDFCENNQLWEYKLGARISNSGAAADTLMTIRHTVKKGGKKIRHSVLAAGARLITEKTGHVLPFAIQPHTTVVVEGVANLGLTMREMTEMAEDMDTPWKMTHKFIFKNSRNQSVTLSTFDPSWLKK